MIKNKTSVLTYMLKKSIKCMYKWGWVVGLRPIVRSWDLDQQGCALCEVVSKGSYPYLLGFRRKPRKTPNGSVGKHDWGLNLAPQVY